MTTYNFKGFKPPTGMDWLLDRTVESCSIGVAFGQSSFTDLDFADDVSLL